MKENNSKLYHKHTKWTDANIAIIIVISIIIVLSANWL